MRISCHLLDLDLYMDTDVIRIISDPFVYVPHRVYIYIYIYVYIYIYRVTAHVSYNMI